MDNKDYSISVIRLISMIMIITCHILQGLNNSWAFWINVGVQIFFFISGFLYGKRKIKNYCDFYKKRISKIMFPYMIILTIVLLLDVFLLKNTYSIKRIIGCYIGLGAFSSNVPILSHTWFVSYILLCYLIIPILQMFFNQSKYKNSFLLFVLIMLLILLFQIYGVINIESAWINNFIMGYFYGNCCKEKKQKKIFTYFIILLFIIIIPLAIIYQENIQIILPSILNNYNNIIINYGHVLLGTIIFLFLYKLFKYIKFKKNIILAFSDKYSYYIYLVHQIFILYSFSILYLTKYLFVNIMLILLFSIIASFILKVINDFLLMFVEKVKSDQTIVYKKN